MSEVSPVAVCDTCGKPLEPDAGIYSIASKFDDDDNLISFRHYDCRVDVTKALDNLRDRIKDAEKALRNLR